MAVYVWYSRNREGGGRASGGVEVSVNRSLDLRVSSIREGLEWVELRGRGEKEIDDRSGLCESSRCESKRDREAI